MKKDTFKQNRYLLDTTFQHIVSIDTKYLKQIPNAEKWYLNGIYFAPKYLIYLKSQRHDEFPLVGYRDNFTL